MKLVLVCAVFLASCYKGESESLISLGTLAISETLPYTNSSGFPIVTNGCTKDGCVGTVYIYLSDANHTRGWGTIKANVFDVYGRNIACRQLGYSRNNNTQVQREHPAPNDSPIWLKDVLCGNAPDDKSQYLNNILQCNISHCQDCTDHSDDLVLSCDGQLDRDGEKDYYDGEVLLLPPEQKPHGMQTTMGLIQIFLNDEKGGITIANTTEIGQYFASSKRETICKQIGFTGDVTDSVYTKYSLEVQGYTFPRYNGKYWFDVSELNDECNNFGPSQCFGCCFDYPDTQGCSTEDCKEANLLAISCLYETLNENPEYAEKGNEEKCKFVGKKLLKKADICSSKQDYPDVATLIGFMVFFIMLSVAFPIGIVTGLICKKKEWYKKCPTWGERHGHNILEDNN